MGYDAFGLPAENYAIKSGVHPQDSTLINIKDIREQLKRIGCMYDWNAELMTCVPEYYKWNQWLFLQLYKKGLAYRKKLLLTGVQKIRLCLQTNRFTMESVRDAEQK